MTETRTIKERMARIAMTLLLLFMTTATSWAVEYEVESLTGNHGSFTLTGWVFEAYSHGGITFDLWLIDRATNEEVDRWNVKTSIYRRYCGRYVANGTFGYSTTREVSPGTYTIRSRIYYEEPVRRVVVVQPYQYFATFHTDHGTAPDDLPIPDDLAKSIPPMTCEGYTFVCWSPRHSQRGEFRRCLLSRERRLG